MVELGCGKGDFLVELCQTTNARGTGYDRSYEGGITDERVTFVRDYMSPENQTEFDFFVVRHVVEHLVDPYEFLVELRAACGRKPVRGYVEVPDAIYDFERSPWNCHYPHVSYFSATALYRLGIRAGFGLLRLVRSFEGQYLSPGARRERADARRGHIHRVWGSRASEILQAFRERHPQMVQNWRDRLTAIGYERCIVWGAGAKGLGFLAAVDPDRRIATVVDVNPAKHGRFLPVTGHRIIGPDQVPSLDVKTDRPVAKPRLPPRGPTLAQRTRARCRSPVGTLTMPAWT